MENILHITMTAKRSTERMAYTNFVKSLIWKVWLVAWSAPSHYLNQCWNIVNRTIRNKKQWNFYLNSNIFVHENAYENVVWKMVAILSRPECVNRSKVTLVSSCGTNHVLNEHGDLGQYHPYAIPSMIMPWCDSRTATLVDLSDKLIDL